MDNYGGDGFFGFMNRLGDIVFLNLVFLLTCIPVLTIGNALTALYSVSMKMAEGQEGYVVRGYLKSFKDNLKQGLITGIMLEIILFVLICDSRILYFSNESYRDIGLMVTMAALLFLVMVLQYIFPLMARYNNSIKSILRNAVLLAVGKLPYTLLLVFLMGIPAVLLYFTSYAAVYIIFAGCSVSALLQGKILNRIFSAIESNAAEKKL